MVRLKQAIYRRTSRSFRAALGAGLSVLLLVAGPWWPIEVESVGHGGVNSGFTSRSVLSAGDLTSLAEPRGGEEKAAWITRIQPRREFVVFPSDRKGASGVDYLTLEDAIKSAEPGDLFWLVAGSYKGQFHLIRNGTADRPIVFRAIPGQHVVIEGGLRITGAFTWIWGLEITDPQNLGHQASGIEVYGPGIHLINNVIHDQADKNGIGAWNMGSGQVIYGNILYENGRGPRHPHNVYVQNDFKAYGHKYFVDNVAIDSGNICGNCFNFHAYTEKGNVSGIYLKGNIFANGQFLIGGLNRPADNEVVNENYFYNSAVRFGFKRPAQVEFNDNWVVRSRLSLEWFWGEGEVKYPQEKSNVFLRNLVIFPNGPHVRFRTSAYVQGASGVVRSLGGPRIRSADQFDYNVYSVPFMGSIFAGNVNLPSVDFNGWQRATAAAGNEFDTHSKLLREMKGATVVLLPNDYEDGRAHLVVFSWDRSPEVKVDLSPVVPEGALFRIHAMKQIFGNALVCGEYRGPVMVPTHGEEFSVFLVTTGGAEDC